MVGGMGSGEASRGLYSILDPTSAQSRWDFGEDIEDWEGFLFVSFSRQVGMRYVFIEK